MACAMGYTISPVARAEFIDELLTQDTRQLFVVCDWRLVNLTPPRFAKLIGFANYQSAIANQQFTGPRTAFDETHCDHWRR